MIRSKVNVNSEFETAVTGVAKALGTTPEIVHKFYDRSPKTLVSAYNSYKDADDNYWNSKTKALAPNLVKLAGLSAGKIIVFANPIAALSLILGGFVLGTALEKGSDDVADPAADALNPVRKKLGL